MDQTEYLSYATLFKEALSLATTISVDVIIGIQTRNGRRIWCASEEGLKHELMSKSIKIGVDDVLFQIEHEVPPQPPVAAAAAQLPNQHQPLPPQHHILQHQPPLITHHPHLPPPPYQQHPMQIQGQVAAQVHPQPPPQTEADKDVHRVKTLNDDGASTNGGDDLLNFEMEPMSIKMEGAGGGSASASTTSAGSGGGASAGKPESGMNDSGVYSEEAGSGQAASSSSQAVVPVEYIPGSDPEKPFLCKTCEKPFTSAAHLAIHTRVHTGERSFHCTKCPKSFGKLYSMSRAFYKMLSEQNC